MQSYTISVSFFHVFIVNKSLGGFHLARQNLMELTGLRLDVHSDDQAVTGNQGYFEN